MNPALQAGGDLLAQRRLAEAEACFRSVLEDSPGDPEAIRQLSIVLQLAGRYADLLALADDVLAADPAHPQARLARGNALNGLGRLEEAAAAFRVAVESPDVALETLVRLGVVLAALGRHDEARRALDLAVEADPQNAFARFQRGLLRLNAGDFGGWADYEARWATPQFVAESAGTVPAALVPQLTLAPTPADLAGQRILLIGEQGIGDVVMFASLLPDLLATAASVVLVCDPRLVRLFRASFPQVTVLSPAEARVDSESVDRLVAIASLAGAFRPNAAAFPGAPYLAPSDEARTRWARRLGPRTSALRIGLSWRGGLPASGRALRSVDLSQLAPILDLPGCEFVSLQHGDVAAEVAAAPIRAFPSGDLHDFDDLAGLVANLDLVVTVQTALAHLCGAMGVEGLALVRRNAGYRYLEKDGASLWYPSVRLLRPTGDDGWSGAVEALAAQLRARPS